MSHDQIMRQIVPYFAGELENSTKREIQSHIDSCDACRMAFESFERVWRRLDEMPEEKPSEKLTEKFNAMLAGYQHGAREARHPGALPAWKSLAAKPALRLGFAVALLVIGFVLGVTVTSASTHARVARLADELDDMRQEVMFSMLKQPSSADRLQAVSYSSLVGPRDDVREALQRTLETDPSTNVRLAALRALRPFATDVRLRRHVIDSFSQQKSPLVQVEIVDFIRQTETRPAELLGALEQNENIHRAVRQHIKWTIGTLRGDTIIKENQNERMHY
ncbi:zf-HC2 domain-containing protein [candidate division KSB1 bacterium]|nr:zf-HC2 domain-containing protein [candidate division KSB1 bacterium]